MLPGLGEKYDVTIETVSQSRDTYCSEKYQKSGLPAAPAVMVGEEIIVQGADISQDRLEEVIRRHLAVA
jgi:hypothetical protein